MLFLTVPYYSYLANWHLLDKISWWAYVHFLLNFDKNGIQGYIGYESFAEMSYLVAKKIQNKTNQKIYIYKMPSKEVGCYQEINHFIKLGYIELFK